MYKNRSYKRASEPRPSPPIEPLYELIEIIGDHISRVYDEEIRIKECRGCRASLSNDRMMADAVAELFMTGKFRLRCPYAEVMSQHTQ